MMIMTPGALSGVVDVLLDDGMVIHYDDNDDDEDNDPSKSAFLHRPCVLFLLSLMFSLRRR